jgi:hypothetical protein
VRIEAGVMIEYENTHSRQSRVGRWLMVTATVVVAVPVVLWALVTVVRSYVTPARVPIHRPAALVPGDKPPNAEIAQPAAPAEARAAVTEAQTSAAVAALAAGLPKVDRGTARVAQPVAAPSPPQVSITEERPAQASLPPPLSLTPGASSDNASTIPARPAGAANAPPPPRDAFAAPAWQDSLVRPPAAATAMPTSSQPPVQAQRAQAPESAAPIPAAAEPSFTQRAAIEPAQAGARGADAIPVPPRRPRAVAALEKGVPVPRPRPSDAPPSDPEASAPPPVLGKDHNQF